MDYASTIFGKPLEELSFNDIVSFFEEEQEESNSLEFKAYHPGDGNLDRLLDPIRRGITAFLNSDGGILIWGAPDGQRQERNGQRVKIFAGELSPLDREIEKDRLINKISNSIIPLPVGIKVNILKKIDEALYVYVFEVQKSVFSPHQFNNTYYARLDGQTNPAPHYLIEALFRKITYPDLRGHVNFVNFRRIGNRYLLDITIFMINASALQNEENVTYRLTCGRGAKFANALPPNHAINYTMDGQMFVNKGRIDILHYGVPDCHQETIIIDDRIGQNSIDFLLYFGGKKSPVKVTSYSLEFDFLRERHRISDTEENKLTSDNDITVEEQIQAILGI